MAKPILGIDIGTNRLKLALIKNGSVKKTASVPVPENLFREGRITSPDTLAGLLREAVQKNHMHVQDAAMVLSDDPLYLRILNMPPMTEEQLTYNLPYEFNDYITGELKDYVFDYAVLSLPREAQLIEGTQTKKRPGLFGGKKAEQKSPAVNAQANAASAATGGENGAAHIQENKDGERDREKEYGGAMELLAVAAPEDMILTAREVMHKAGLRLVRAAPVECAFMALIRSSEYGRTPKPLEYCFLDLGYQTIRMYMFRGVHHMATRALDFGLSILDDVVAEHFSVDVHVAHTYFLNNFEDCQNQDYCQRAYSNIAVELMRALNFFRFSNPDSRLSAIWVFGGGAIVEPLREAITQALDLKVHSITGMMPYAKELEDIYTYAPAIGITEAFPGADKSFIHKRPNLPFKISINMARLHEKRVPIGAVLAAILALVIGAALFGKFAVYDLLQDAKRARQEVETVQAQLAMGYDKIESFGEINDIYAHYTTSGMTDDELSSPDRLEVMEMIQRVIMPRTPLETWSLSGNQVTMSIKGATLEAINDTAKAIRAEEMVDYCNVNTAATGNDTVTANIVIHLKNKRRQAE